MSADGTTAGLPTDQELIAALGSRLAAHHPGRRVEALARRPFEHATSYSIEHISITLDDGSTLELLLKNLARGGLLPDARRSKPPLFQEPRRPILTYRRILSPHGIGAAYYASSADIARGRCWLLIEKVPGVELWQVGDLPTWEGVARWTARFHRRFSGRTQEIRRLNPWLLEYDAALLRSWPTGAAALGADHRLPDAIQDALSLIVSRYDAVIEQLIAVPASFIHGELYPSNVMVAGTGSEVSVWPIDWEMAATGPPLLDIVALTTGWAPSEEQALVSAYFDEAGQAWGLSPLEQMRALDCCRLHLALQWFGWSPGWLPPPAHGRDWLADALAAAARLGLIDPDVNPGRPAGWRSTG